MDEFTRQYTGELSESMSFANHSVLVDEIWKGIVLKVECWRKTL